jgi:cobalamin synthase
VPVGAAGAPDARALAWLPLVGCAIGALAGVAAWGASFVAPEPFVVATAFAASIVLSGAVHLDGLLDACDALAASVPPERRLEIMKDPRHGTFAVAGFAVVGVWWLAALWSIPPGVLPFALAFSAGTARAAAVLNAYALPYGRTDASARAFASRPPAAVLGLEAAPASRSRRTRRCGSPPARRRPSPRWRSAARWPAGSAACSSATRTARSSSFSTSRCSPRSLSCKGIEASAGSQRA